MMQAFDLSDWQHNELEAQKLIMRRLCSKRKQETITFQKSTKLLKKMKIDTSPRPRAIKADSINCRYSSNVCQRNTRSRYGMSSQRKGYPIQKSVPVWGIAGGSKK